MKEMLDFGIQIDTEGEPYESYESMEKFIPPKHQYLFTMIQNLPSLADQEDIIDDYVSGKVNRTSLYAVLQNLHPYFKEFKDAAYAVLNRSIAEYLVTMDQSDDEKQAAFERLLFQNHDSMNTELRFWATMPDAETLEEVEMVVQNAAYFVSFILDDSNPELAALSSAARASMYAVVSTDTDEYGRPFALEIPVRITLPQSDGIKGASAMLDFDENLQERVFQGAQDILNGKPLPRVWKTIAMQDNGKAEESIRYYQIYSFCHLIRLELYLMTRDGIRVNRCKKCGKLFPVLEDGQMYCDFGDASHYKIYKDTQRKSMLQKCFTKSVKTQRSRVRKGTETEEEYQKWYKEAKEIQKKAEAEKTEPDIFEKQLAKIDPHRKI
ncbi:MAG: hypothetical protein PUE47_05800 [Lachnospiraceae bacterium]|nr:hypothetical protein [Lachnospiraceae bacterium]